MATSGLYGNSSESIGLYGNTNVFGGTYFQWFIFQQNNDQPVTPTGGTWDFTTNTGTPPTGWTTVVASVAVNPVWFSTGFVDSRNPTVIVWSVPSLLTSSNSIYATAYSQTFTGNGTQTAFTLSSSPVTVNNTDVSINGVVQVPGVDYTVNSVTLTTTTPVINGAVMLVKYKQSLPNSYYGAASNVQFTPVGALTSTNVQSAIAEVVTDLALSSGSSTVGYLPAGTNAVATTVQTKLRESVSVLDFMTAAQITDVQANTASIDVTTAVQAALTASVAVIFPPGTYLVSAVTLQGYQKISGYGATIKAATAAGKVFTVVEGSAGLQTVDYTEIAGLSFVGYSASVITSGSAGIYTTTSSSLFLRDVRVKNFQIGFYLGGSQFCSFYSIKAYACTVGVYIKSSATAGGGNSNSFYDLITLSCTTYGVLIVGQAPFNTSANYFRNYTGNGNLCALGLFNGQCYIDGGAPETNSGVSTTFDGYTSAGGTFYANDSNIFIANLSDQDAASTTVVYAENNSDVNLVNPGGFGNVSAKYCTCDSTSTLITTGNTLINGSLQNVFGNINLSSGSNGGNLFNCADTSYLSVSLPNECTSPLTSTLSNANIVTATTVWDSTYGLVGNLVFAASAASQDANRIFLGQISNNSGFSVIGVSVYSATNTSVTLGMYGYTYQQSSNLIAGRWTRLYYVMQNSAIPSTTGYVLYPSSTDAPTIRVAKVMIYSAATYDAGAVQAINAVLGGAYNPQVGALHYGRKASAAPTTGTFVVGDVVYNSAPASAGYVGWVCTVAGTPGTWKTFGLIS